MDGPGRVIERPRGLTEVFLGIGAQALGQLGKPQNRGLRIPASRIAIGAGALAAVLATAWAITTDSPLRGRPLHRMLGAEAES